MSEIRYPYKPKLGLFIFAIIVFVLIALAFSIPAISHKGDMLLFGTIRFSQAGAKSFYWFLVLGSGAMVAAGIIGLRVAKERKLEIVLGDASISAPKSLLFNKPILVEFNQINKLDVMEVFGQRILNIHHANGKLNIPDSMFPDKQKFDELVETLSERVGPTVAGLGE